MGERWRGTVLHLRILKTVENRDASRKRKLVRTSTGKRRSERSDDSPIRPPYDANTVVIRVCHGDEVAIG